MVISSKGRYALRVMVDLAEHGGDGYVSMRDVARRQEISDKYAGQIMTLLSRAGLVDGVTGKGGGYRLNGAYAVVKQFPNIRFGKGKPLPPHIDFRNVQEFFHQLRHAVALRQNHLRRAGRVHHARLYALRIALYRHQRRFQLVGGILEEGLLPLRLLFNISAEAEPQQAHDGGGRQKCA